MIRLKPLLWFALVAVLATSLCGCRCQSETAANAQPNLVMVLVDTLRADHVGYHGYTRATTPNIDAMKQRSIAFMNHRSHASRTGPAVASIFTGLHPRSHGVVNPLTKRDAKGILAEDQVTLAEILSRHGYTCRGFIGNLNIKRRFGFAQGFDSYEFIKSSTAPDINKLALPSIRQTTAPYFFYLHYMEPHSPYKAPAKYRGLFESSSYKGPITGGHRQLNDIIRGKISPNARDIQRLETLYDRDIRYFDDEFQRVVELLESTETLDNTIFVFLADHGEEFWDHGSVLHGYTLYEEQLHVPLFISAPGFKGGREVSGTTRHVDILPTLLDLLQIEENLTVQGRSLVPWMEGEKSDQPTGPVYAQASLRAVKAVQGESYMDDQGWKLIRMRVPELKEELYHTANDPNEQNDSKGAMSEKAQELRDKMLKFEQKLPVGRGGEVTLTQEEIERLRSLGYMN